MAAADEDALTCDFAETYHVLRWRALPARLAATLAAGLRPDSRIMLRLTGAKVPRETLLAALAVDALQLLVWQNTRDGVKGRNRPPSIVKAMTEEPKPKLSAFDSPEAFDAWRAEKLAAKKEVI